MYNIYVRRYTVPINTSEVNTSATCLNVMKNWCHLDDFHRNNCNIILNIYIYNCIYAITLCYTYNCEQGIIAYVMLYEIIQYS